MNNPGTLPKLRIDGLAKLYGQRAVIADIDLHVQTGEVVVLLGPSGCGKTTLLRMIAGFTDPDRGRIAINDVEVASAERAVPPEKRSLSMVFQNYAIWPHKTVSENLAYGLKLKRLDAAAIRAKIATALDTVHMAPYADRYPAELSGGQQQRVALARALVLEPEILLFDEPLSNLDAFLRERMRSEIRSILNDLGTTSIYVTHDQTEAMAIADRIVVMNQGHIEQVGSPRDIYHASRTEFVASFVGSANILAIDDVTDQGSGQWQGRSPDLGALSFMAAGDAPAQCRQLYVRPEDIELLPAATAASDDTKPGTVTQCTFLGPTAEYVVALSPETSIRVVRPGHEALLAPGSATAVRLPPARCRALHPTPVQASAG